jgi:hypothetical protein
MLFDPGDGLRNGSLAGVGPGRLISRDEQAVGDLVLSVLQAAAEIGQPSRYDFAARNHPQHHRPAQLDLPGQIDLTLPRQQRDNSDLLEVGPHRVGRALGDRPW